MVRMRDNEREPELRGQRVQQVEQRDRIRSTRHRDKRFPGLPEEPGVSHVSQHARRQRVSSAHVS